MRAPFWPFIIASGRSRSFPNLVIVRPARGRAAAVIVQALLSSFDILCSTRLEDPSCLKCVAATFCTSS